jgi:hypothetical protein
MLYNPFETPYSQYFVDLELSLMHRRDAIIDVRREYTENIVDLEEKLQSDIVDIVNEFDADDMTLLHWAEDDAE